MLVDSIRPALWAYARFVEAETVQRGRVLDPNADYKGANIEYVRARAQLSLAMDTMKAALAADAVRGAAEAGSPAARLFEPNGGK